MNIEQFITTMGGVYMLAAIAVLLLTGLVILTSKTSRKKR
jgi:hypothetical protein